MRNTYFFQQTRPFLETIDTSTPVRAVRSVHESGARDRLPKPGPGRTWKLIKTNVPAPPPTEPYVRETQIVPVLLDGKHDDIIGFAEVRSDGSIDLTLNQLRVTESKLPQQNKIQAVSINVTYQGLCALKRKV